MPNFRKPPYPHFRFTKKQARCLRQKLVADPVWKTLKSVGSGARGPCLLINDSNVRIRNPFHPKGPMFLYPKQIMFIQHFGFLPDNSKRNEDDDKHIDLSHMCGDELCINVVGNHIKAEPHWMNIIRKLHHLLIKKEREKELKDMRKKTTRNLRTRSGSQLVCRQLSRKNCKCNCTCFRYLV